MFGSLIGGVENTVENLNLIVDSIGVTLSTFGNNKQ